MSDFLCPRLGNGSVRGKEGEVGLEEVGGGGGSRRRGGGQGEETGESEVGEGGYRQCTCVCVCVCIYIHICFSSK